jgi:hypothetical protein
MKTHSRDRHDLIIFTNVTSAKNNNFNFLYVFVTDDDWSGDGKTRGTVEQAGK